jgi:hypothetical protein
MRKIKIFKSVENDLTALENEINDWITTHGIDVVAITGNIAPQTMLSGQSGSMFASSDVLLIVTYEAQHE